MPKAQQNLSEDEVYLKCRTDFDWYAQRALRIKPKTGLIEPFKLNEGQLYAHECFERQKEKQGYIRALVLKARQVGISTYVGGRFYHKTSLHRGQTAMVMAHEDKATANLFSMTKLYHEQCPELLQPTTKASNARELVFDDDKGTGLKSKYILQTAGSQRAGGRSFTIHALHCSEVAFWGDSGATILGGALESVPSESPGIEGTEVILESTANGLDGVFYAKWKEVEKSIRNGEPTDWQLIFIPWYFHSTYKRALSETELDYIQNTLDDSERWLMEQKNQYGEPVSLEQIAWRRHKMKDLMPPIGMSREEFFMQEYPATAEEAFVSSGRPVFNLRQLIKLADELQPPIVRYEMQIGTGNWVQDPRGRLSVWEEPSPAKAYVIGADVAEGLIHGDYSSVDVLDHRTGEQVAQWHGKIHPEQLGDVIYWLGIRYGNAWVAPERNNHGLTTITRLQNLGYKRLYQESAVDSPGSKARKRYGWLTNKKTKPLMIDTLHGEMLDEIHGIRCKETVEEMKTYEIKDDGAYEAQEGECDDRIISLAIAKQVRRLVPSPALRTPTPESHINLPAAAAKGRRKSGWKGHV